MTTLGEAIALGTLAQPVRTQALTNAVNRYQQIDLQKKAAEAKRLKEEKDFQQDLSKLIYHGDGGFSPLYQDEVNELVSGSLVRQYDAVKRKDRVGTSAEAARLKNILEDKHAEDKALQAGLAALEKEGLLSTNLSRIPYSRKDEAIKIYQDEVVKNPALGRILSLDENGRFSTHVTKNIDIDNDLRAIGKSYDKLTPVMSNGRRETVRLGDTTFYKTQADPKIIAQQSISLAQDPNVMTNVMIKYRPEYEKAVVSISKDPEAKNATPEQIQMLATAEVLRNRLTRYAQGHEDIRDRAPRTSSSISSKSFIDKYTVVSTPYESYKKVITPVENSTETALAGKLPFKIDDIKNTRVVAIESNKGGSDTESIQLNINGKQVRPVNYIIDDKTGKIIMNYATNKAIGERQNGNKIYDTVNESIVVDDTVLTNLAAHYGFGGEDGVSKFKKEALGINPKTKNVSKYQKSQSSKWSNNKRKV